MFEVKDVLQVPKRLGEVRIYGDSISGNCLKVKWVADRLGLAYDWVEIDIRKNETRTEAFLALNPFGQVPVVEFENGRTLAQSNAIIVHLADTSALVPTDSFERARMFEWLWWIRCVGISRRASLDRPLRGRARSAGYRRGRHLLGVPEIQRLRAGGTGVD